MSNIDIETAKKSAEEAGEFYDVNKAPRDDIEKQAKPEKQEEPEKQDETERQGETERQMEIERRALLLALARHVLESNDFDAQLSKNIFAMIRGHLNADILFNYRVAADGSLDLVVALGIADEFQPLVQHLEPGQAFCGRVAASKEPLSANKELICIDSAGALVQQMGVTAYACHPLLGRDGKVLGTFSIGSTRREEFLPSEVEFLQTVSHFLAIAWDRHLAEQQLLLVSEESERRKRLYETILSNTPDLAYVWNLDHRFTYANEILLKMWGKTWDEAIGKNCLELGYEPWHAAMHDREIEQVVETKQAVRGEVPFAGTFGRRIYDYILVPVFGPDGEVEAVAGTTRDITLMKEAQQEAAKLLETEKNHALLIEKVANTSKSLNTLLSAKSIAQLVTDEARSIIGAHQAVVSLTRSNDWSQSINAVSLSDKYAEYRDYSTQPDGSGIYAEVCASNTIMRLTQQELEAHPRWKNFGNAAKDHPPMRGWLAVPLIGHGEKNLGLLQLSDKYEGDFTQDDEAILIQLAAIASAGIENATAYEKLHDQDRRKDEFLATLAHELRNPLAPIRSGVAVLSRSNLPDNSAKTLEMMERQVSHMVHLIDDLLDVSRISSGKIQLKKELIQLDKIVQAALEVSRPIVEAGQHQLYISTPAKDILLEADPTRIAQVISNLLNNAAKYTPYGGRIELVTEQKDGEAIISVKDNGDGIFPEMTSKIFELFTQAGKELDRSHGGLGIGLAISKQLVEMHGGVISATSDGAGKGSVFSFRLPLGENKSDDTNFGNELTDTNKASSSHRILVVDDNVDGADMLSTLLEISGHEVQTAYDGFEALKAAKTYQPELVFLDIGLPGMNGYEVAQKLLAELSNNKPILVALTGWGASDDKQRAQDVGFDYHFTKPIEITKIEQLLNTIWNKTDS